MTVNTLGSAAGETHAAHFQPRIDLRKFPPGTTFLRILGVDYVHVSMGDKGDLYLTNYGAPYYQHLLPENWYEQPWLGEKRQRLQGTGTVYRLPTRPVGGHLRPSIDLCIKWSRVGQDVPLDTFTLYRNINAEFNSPFEEFALVEELRRGEYGPRNLRIRTQKPLGIYVPSERMQLWQTGRSRDKVMARIARRPGVEIDILRAYILIYGWISGLDAITAYEQCAPPPEGRQAHLAAVTKLVETDLQAKGFRVADHKPVHIITRVRDSAVRQRPDSKVAYAIVDYELLERTGEHEDAVKRAARSDYLVRQRDRFRPRNKDVEGEFPVHLHPAQVLGVDYVYGRTESTGGALWVVGKDPDLFAYFLPERWRMRHVVLSDTGQAYYVQTKDRIHLVWKVSRVGEIPPCHPEQKDSTAVRARIQHGYNAPFEKVALALAMAQKGVRTSYPRAIYMTGPGKPDENLADLRRFDAFADLHAPDGKPVLPKDHDYITLFGYWRGRDDDEAVEDMMLWTPIDLAQAAAKGIISAPKAEELLERHRRKLQAAGFVDLDLKADHVLLSYIPGGAVKIEPDGCEELRHCNFELVARIS
jgi:hypothetical protein